METGANVNKQLIDSMFKAGAHFAFRRSKRHPQAAPFIYGSKNNVEIFDLEKTSENLLSALNFVEKIAEEGKQLLFIGGKQESQEAVKNAAISLGMPYVAGRWIGGTFTNFVEIKKRIEKMERLMVEKEKGELAKYTKKERLLIDRDIDKLQKFFYGIRNMKDKPAAIFVIDQKREKGAVEEARRLKIPIIGLSGSDSNYKDVDYAIPGNDSSMSSINFFVNEIAEAYRRGAEKRMKKDKEEVKTV